MVEKRKEKMLKDERGQMSIDFLAGLALFILALLFLAQFIPGMFVPFQSETIDLSSVAYRTSVILVEDPGWYNGTIQGEDWENDIANVSRVGLAIDKGHPNKLNTSKRDVFENKTLIDNENLTQKLGLYRKIGDNPIDYGYNISIDDLNGTILAARGEIPPEYGDVVKMKRIVWMQTGFTAEPLSNESLEGAESSTKALFYINSSDVVKFLDGSVSIRITNFNFTVGIRTYKGIKLANTVTYAAGDGYHITQPNYVNGPGGYASLLNVTGACYEGCDQDVLSPMPDWTIDDKNDTLKIFMAKSVFENEVSLTIDGSEDVFIEVDFGNGIVVKKVEEEDYPPGEFFTSILVPDYEPTGLIVKVWQ